MATLSPYLNFNGNCEEAFTFYRSVFGGEFPYVGRYKDMPPAEGSQPMPEGAGDKIMHISLPVGDSYIMGSDAGGEWTGKMTIGDNVQLSLNAGNNGEADQWFNGLSAGGQVKMPMANTFWGSYFGMLTDKFGINWMVSCEPKRDDKAGQN